MEEGGRKVIKLDAEQIANFAGAALELSGSEGRVLAMSGVAWRPSRRDNALLSRIRYGSCHFGCRRSRWRGDR
jgi:hypothetical protein